jgi:hypothetical protein
VDDFAGITILPGAAVTPNDVATLKQQIKAAPKRH